LRETFLKAIVEGEQINKQTHVWCFADYDSSRIDDNELLMQTLTNINGESFTALARDQFYVCAPIHFVYENGITTELRQGIHVTYCIFHLHLGKTEMQFTPCGSALGFVRPMRIKMAGRTCLSFCMFYVEDSLARGLDTWISMVAIQEMSRMTSTCLDRLCLAILGTVGEDQELRYDFNSTLQEDPATSASVFDSEVFSRFRLQNEIQRYRLDTTRGYRVSKCALAEIVLLTLYDFNKCLMKLHPYYNTPVTKRKFANRCATVNVQDTTVTTRFMVRQSRQLRSMEQLSSFTELVAKEAERLTSDCAPHTIAFFLHNSWTPGSAERRTTWAVVDYEARLAVAENTSSFQESFAEGWMKRIGGPVYLNSYDCSPDKPLSGPIEDTHCGDVPQEMERGVMRWIEDGRTYGRRGVGLSDYQPICADAHLLDAIIVNHGDIKVFTDPAWKRPLVVELIFHDVLPDYLREVKEASYPSTTGPPVAKAARPSPSAGSSGGVSTYQTPLFELTEPPPIVQTGLQQTLASEAAVGAEVLPVPVDRPPVVPKAVSVPVPSTPSTPTKTASLESNVETHMEVEPTDVSMPTSALEQAALAIANPWTPSTPDPPPDSSDPSNGDIADSPSMDIVQPSSEIVANESSGTSFPAMAPPTTTSTFEPQPEPSAMAMTVTSMVPPPPSHTLAHDSGLTESLNRPINAKPIEGQSAAAASPPEGTGILPTHTPEGTGILPTHMPAGTGILPPEIEVSADTGTRLPTGAGVRTSLPPEAYPSEGPLKDLLDLFGQIGEVPNEDLEICIGSLESRIAEGVRHRNTAAKRKNWTHLKMLVDRDNMFHVHLNIVTEELVKRSSN